MLLVVFYPPLVGWWSVTEALDEDALTAHKRGGRATDQPARRERVLGPLRLPPPFLPLLATDPMALFHFSSVRETA